jgi:two-component system OmpR family sensor kinase
VSLRARLLTGLVALVTVGLIAMAAITYFEQRSFLLQRADDQAATAVPYMQHALEEDRALRTPPDGGGGPGGGGPGGAGPAVNLPPGTYGQHRDTNGKIVKTGVVTYGQAKPPVPNLPATIQPGKLFTVDAKGDSSLRYRVLARRAPDGDLTVVAIPLRDTDQTLNRLLVVSGLVIAGVVAALAALSWWLVGLGLRPLDRMGHVAGAIAAGDLSRRVEPADERTEVGRLGLALNGMLAQIERAFAEREASQNRLRRFVADASHELRTPLASIRGYAELFRMGAAREPAEAEKAIGRIEDESTRMGVLVEDLLTLARLDQLPEPIRLPVELTEIARDAVDDARVAAPDREIQLVTDGDDTTVLGDASQLRQVIGNLMRNALVHTPAGSPVELTVGLNNGDAAVTVRDHGPGLPDADVDSLFERFWRADPGRERGPAGAGLGLSIVASVVAGHGGRVEARNAPDGGAEFTVRLPQE